MVHIRKARETDVPRLVEIFRVSRQRLLPFLPILHTRAQDFTHLKDMMARGEVYVGIVAEKLVGFLVRIDDWVAHLYVHPDMIARGVGVALLDHAKTKTAQLDLWCFEDNHRARAFYEAQGFKLVRTTDGDNEEGLPDRLYHWARG